MKFTPTMNDGGHIFVFGSNEAGVHGAGAAFEAFQSWGAEWGVGEGRTGNAYAIPTKDKNIETRDLFSISWSVDRFKKYAANHPGQIFLVTAIGCGLAGYHEDQIKPMFADAPTNCVLPEGWRKREES